ncbi:MAG: NADH-quinone oxidoreductase subunit NuoE [Oceanicaulis sp.]
MSVRRLSTQQPDTFAFSKESEEKVKFWLNKYPEERRASAVIPLLWIVQKQENWIPEPAMRQIAERLEMPYIRVYEVATFYTMFNLAPTGEHLIQVCGTTPCWLRGADGLKAVCETKIGPKGRAHVSNDGKLAWEEVECLGACANAPMVQISNTAGDHYYEDLTPEALEQMLDDLVAGKAIEPGPITKRHASEPTQAKVDVLTEESLYDGSRAQAITELPHAVKTSEPAAKSKAAKTDREETEKKTGPSIAKPAAKDKAEAEKPKAGQPKTPPKKRPAKASGGAKSGAATKPASKTSTAAKKPAAKKTPPKTGEE